MGDKARPAIAALVEQLLDDPLVRLVMNADRIDRADAQALFQAVAFTFENRKPPHQMNSTEALTMTQSEPTAFRQGVGVVLFNGAGKIFVGERIDLPGEWQMPQGGIDADEIPLAAALRELREEIGSDKVELLSQTRDWLTYELPTELVGQTWGGRWRGQQQKWFSMLFTGEDSDIKIATDHPEFSSWRWVSLQEAVDLVTPFKRHVYEQVVREFEPPAGPSGPITSRSEVDPPKQRQT